MRFCSDLTLVSPRPTQACTDQHGSCSIAQVASTLHCGVGPGMQKGHWNARRKAYDEARGLAVQQHSTSRVRAHHGSSRAYSRDVFWETDHPAAYSSGLWNSKHQCSPPFSLSRRTHQESQPADRFHDEAEPTAEVDEESHVLERHGREQRLSNVRSMGLRFCGLIQHSDCLASA